MEQLLLDIAKTIKETSTNVLIEISIEQLNTIQRNLTILKMLINEIGKRRFEDKWNK